MPNRLLRTCVIFVATLILTTYANDELLKAHRRKHDTKLESWSCALRLHHKQDTIHAAAFFISGKLLFMSGNFVYSSIFNNTEGTYKSESKALLPPFQSVRHDNDKLDERFGPNRIFVDPLKNHLHLNMMFPQAKISLSAPIHKHSVWFADIFNKPRSQSRFNWYVQPLSNLSAKIQGKQGTYTGDGYFQHYWGEMGAQNSDWFVALLDDGGLLIGAHFSPDTRGTSWLPEDYLLRVGPDGTKRLLNDITFSVSQSFQGSKGSYPTSVQIRTSDEDTIFFDAFHVDQISKISTREAWNGFGTVNAKIEGKESKGWAYFSPFARKE